MRRVGIKLLICASSFNFACNLNSQLIGTANTNQWFSLGEKGSFCLKNIVGSFILNYEFKANCVFSLWLQNIAFLLLQFAKLTFKVC